MRSFGLCHFVGIFSNKKLKISSKEIAAQTILKIRMLNRFSFVIKLFFIDKIYLAGDFILIDESGLNFGG